jgi:hypothetical protein
VRSKENRDILERFRAKPRTICIPITDATSEWFAEIKRQLALRESPFPPTIFGSPPVAWSTALAFDFDAISRKSTACCVAER